MRVQTTQTISFGPDLRDRVNSMPEKVQVVQDSAWMIYTQTYVQFPQGSLRSYNRGPSPKGKVRMPSWQNDQLIAGPPSWRAPRARLRLIGVRPLCALGAHLALGLPGGGGGPPAGHRGGIPLRLGQV